jgi:hypothetical protein
MNTSGGRSMIPMRQPWLLSLLAALAFAASAGAAAGLDKGPPAGWKASSPRDEIRPEMTYLPGGGRDGKGCFVIKQDGREGLHGFWSRAFDVKGGGHYRIQAWRRLRGVATPRVSAAVRVLWQDDRGRKVPLDEPAAKGYLIGWTPTAEAEYPGDGQTDPDGWTEVSETYRAPSKATRAVVELHGQWAPGGTIEWAQVSFTAVAPPKPRTVRLATVHFRPRGKSPRENCRELAPLVAEAARQTARARPMRSAPRPCRGPRRSSSPPWRRSTTCTSWPASSSATGT